MLHILVCSYLRCLFEINRISEFKLLYTFNNLDASEIFPKSEDSEWHN